MTKKIFIVSILLISVALTSCMRDGSTCATNEKYKISIVAEVNNTYKQTKSSSKTSFKNNDNIGIYWVNYKDDSPLPLGTPSEFMNVEYVYNNSYWHSKDGEDLYLPTDNAIGDIYAYHPFDYEMSRHPNKKNLKTYPFTVERDQSLSSVNSDFLWAKYSGISIQNTAAKLTFQHLFSKMTLNITYGDLGNNYEDILIQNVTREAIIDLETGMVWDTGINTNIKPYVHATANKGFDKTLSAIVVPQIAYSQKPLFSITINNEEYAYILDETLFLDPGFEYTFNLIIGEAKLKSGSQNTISLVSKSPF